MKKILLSAIVAIGFLAQLPTSYAKTSEMKEWTFLVFMNGHDGAMSPYTDLNLHDMEKVGSTDDINVVVQVASLDREETERVYVQKGSHKIVETMPRVDMGDYKELNKFIEWAVQNYPAKKYFIDVWNHGMGWHDIRKFDGGGNPQFQTHDVSFDSLTGNKITTEQMGKVMKKFAELTGDKVELYGNDACLMAMIEIAAEFTDSVKYFASSQENEPLKDWPYAKLLERWSQNPTVDGAEVGKILTEEYLKLYPNELENPVGTTFSVIDVSQLDGLMESLNNLSNALMGLDQNQKVALKNIAIATHRFELTDYKDLFDFISRLDMAPNLGVNKSTLSDVKMAFKNVVVKNVNTETHKGAHGLSVWLPTFEPYYHEHIERYKKLTFNKKTNWSEFLPLLVAE